MHLVLCALEELQREFDCVLESADPIEFFPSALDFLFGLRDTRKRARPFSQLPLNTLRVPIGLFDLRPEPGQSIVKIRGQGLGGNLSRVESCSPTLHSISLALCFPFDRLESASRKQGLQLSPICQGLLVRLKSPYLPCLQSVAQFLRILSGNASASGRFPEALLRISSAP